MSSKEELIIARQNLRQQIVQLPQILESDPQEWWPNFVNLYRHTKRQDLSNPPEVREYLSHILDMTRTVFKDNHQLDEQNLISATTESLIVRLSILMASEFQPQTEGINENFISINDLVASRPDQLKLSKYNEEGIDFLQLGIKNPATNEWHQLLLPKDKKIWLKGGPPRAVLDIVVDSPIEMLKSELPWNDIDVIATGDEHQTQKISKIMGVDPEGIEMIGSNGHDPDFTLYCLGRDSTQNQVYLGDDGLHFSDAAHYAAQTGNIKVIGQYIGGRAIYGVDLMNFAGVELVKPRGLMRLVKAVVEGKAISYEHIPANSVMDMGIYLLVLSRRWSNKPLFGEYMQRMYYLCKQMGQVRDGENDIYDVLTRAHSTYQFFDFNSPPMNDVGVTRWKAGKLIKQMDREFGWKYRIPTGIQVPSNKGDMEPRLVSLKGFTSSPHQSIEFAQKWPLFVEACQQETKNFYTQNTDLVARYFLKSDLEESILDQINFEELEGV